MTSFNVLSIFSHFWAVALSTESRLQQIVVGMLLVGLPIIVAMFSFSNDFVIDDTSYGSLVSIFSIFGAFLFASQVSVFTVFRILLNPNSIEAPGSPDDTDAEVQRSLRQEKVTSLVASFRGINVSISYLVLLSIIILAALFLAVAVGIEAVSMSAAILFTSAHFFFVLILVVRLCHLVFDNGYLDR